MTTSLGIGIIAIAMAVVAFAYVMLEPDFMKLRSEQMRAEDKGTKSDEAEESTPVFDAINGLLDRLGWKGFSEEQLAEAGIKVGRNSMTAIALLVAIGATLLVQVLTSNLFLGLVAGVAGLFATKAYVTRRTNKRKQKFNKQMSETMTLLSSALKSGMNVPTALASTATEMEAPMGEELARVVNESRLGRDLVVAMRETAERMESADFLWVTEAIAIQRESGGRLSEILDRVTETIAERNELQQKIHSLAAEGRASAAVLMALPIGIGVLFSVVNPEFMEPLFTTTTGYILIGVAAVFYAIGGTWLNMITKVKL
jgi:tight adherence protein B